jgi:hypothetical protein
VGPFAADTTVPVGVLSVIGVVMGVDVRVVRPEKGLFGLVWVSH